MNRTQEPAGLLRSVSWTLLIGDLVCFAVFALLGLRNHEAGITLDNLARAMLPFQLSWLVAGAFYRVFDPPSGAPSSAWRRVLYAWVPAWGLGYLLRILVFGRGFVLAFAIVSLLANAALLVAWRTAAAYIEQRRAHVKRGGDETSLMPRL